jgi:predicted RNA binding protein YcfA (HicA-like mRNA interferase family)
MRIPRDVSADQLVKALQKFGYFVSHQKGSHIRVTTIQMASITKPFQTIPRSRSVRFQRYFNIARHHKITVEVLLFELKLWRQIET